MATICTRKYLPGRKNMDGLGYKFRKKRGIFVNIMLAALPHQEANNIQSGASGERLGWVDLDLGCSTILLGQ